jgi:hypothetical protein
LKWKVLEKMDQPEGPPNERKGSLVMGPLPLVPVFSQVNGAQAFAREEKIIFFSLCFWTHGLSRPTLTAKTQVIGIR